MLLGKTNKEYFERKVKSIDCIYFLRYINCDEEWVGLYKNPSQPARYDNMLDASSSFAFF